MGESTFGTITGPGPRGVATYGRREAIIESTGTLVEVLTGVAIADITRQAGALETARRIGAACPIGTIVEPHEAFVYLHTAVDIKSISGFADTYVASRHVSAFDVGSARRIDTLVDVVAVKSISVEAVARPTRTYETPNFIGTGLGTVMAVVRTLVDVDATAPVAVEFIAIGTSTDKPTCCVEAAFGTAAVVDSAFVDVVAGLAVSVQGEATLTTAREASEVVDAGLGAGIDVFCAFVDIDTVHIVFGDGVTGLTTAGETTDAVVAGLCAPTVPDGAFVDVVTTMSIGVEGKAHFAVACV
jgi:hypothetical protein